MKGNRNVQLNFSPQFLLGAAVRRAGIKNGWDPGRLYHAGKLFLHFKLMGWPLQQQDYHPLWVFSDLHEAFRLFTQKVGWVPVPRASNHLVILIGKSELCPLPKHVDLVHQSESSTTKRHYSAGQYPLPTPTPQP